MTGHTSAAGSKEAILGAYRRDALLNAAVRVFGECGFDSATMERIAHEADVAKGTTYLYYRSKQSIYDAALERGLAEIDARTQAVMDRAANLRDAIFQNRDFFRMYVGAIARRITSTNAKPSEIQSLVDRQPRRLEQAIARAIGRREIRRVDPAATALAIFDITRGLVARRIASSGTRDIGEDVQFVADMVWKGLKEEGRRTKEEGSREEGRRFKGRRKRQRRSGHE
jgi:AcrR family transcriptional regulator